MRNTDLRWSKRGSPLGLPTKKKKKKAKVYEARSLIRRWLDKVLLHILFTAIKMIILKN